MMPHIQDVCIQVLQLSYIVTIKVERSTQMWSTSIEIKYIIVELKSKYFIPKTKHWIVQMNML